MKFSSSRNRDHKWKIPTQNGPVFGKQVKPSGGVFDEFPYIFGNWSGANENDWLILALLAVFAVCLGSMLAGAYKAAPPAIISTFEYSYLVFVVIWDIVVFNVAPTIGSSIGMVMIVSAGLLFMRGRASRSATDQADFDIK